MDLRNELENEVLLAILDRSTPDSAGDAERRRELIETIKKVLDRDDLHPSISQISETVNDLLH